MVNPKDKTAPGAPGATDQAEPAGEHVESLESIGQLGQQLEVPAAAPGAPSADAMKAKASAEISRALALLRMSAIPFAPPHVQDPLHLVWSDKQLTEISEAIVELCGAQGISVDEFFVKYGPWLRLAFALGIPAALTVKLLKMPPPEAVPAAADGQQQ